MAIEAWDEFPLLSQLYPTRWTQLPAKAQVATAWRYAPPIWDAIDDGRDVDDGQVPRASQAASVDSSNAAPEKSHFSSFLEMTGLQGDGAAREEIPRSSIFLSEPLSNPGNREQGESESGEARAAGGEPVINPPEGDDFEFYCDVTDAKIDSEKEGRYHHGSDEDGLDMSVSAFRKFRSLSAEHSKQWGLLPAGARVESAWRYVGATGGEEVSTGTEAAAGGQPPALMGLDSLDGLYSGVVRSK